VKSEVVCAGLSTYRPGQTHVEVLVTVPEAEALANRDSTIETVRKMAVLTVKAMGFRAWVANSGRLFDNADYTWSYVVDAWNRPRKEEMEMDAKLTKVSFGEVVPGRLFAEVTVTMTPEEVAAFDFQPMRKLLHTIRAQALKVLRNAGIVCRKGRTFMNKDNTAQFFFVVGGEA